MSVHIHLEVRSPATGEIDEQRGDYKISLDAEYDTAAGAIRVGRDLLDRLEVWLVEGHQASDADIDRLCTAAFRAMGPLEATDA